MIVRPIETRDIKACVDIYNYYIENSTATFEEEPMTVESFGDRVATITKSYPYIVLEDEGEILGYAYLAPYNERSAYRITADLSIYVKKDLRSKGLGAMLYNAIEPLGKEIGITQIVSIITGENLSSVAFHEKMGFFRCGYMVKVGLKFGRILDTFLYQKSI